MPIHVGKGVARFDIGRSVFYLANAAGLKRAILEISGCTEAIVSRPRHGMAANYDAASVWFKHWYC